MVKMEFEVTKDIAIIMGLYRKVSDVKYLNIASSYMRKVSQVDTKAKVNV